MTAALLLGSLDLMDPTGPYRIEALGTDSGTTWGNPETIEVQLRSLLQYGSLVITEGIENRVPVIAVSVRGDDMNDVADSEAALMAELYRVNTLSYTSTSAWVPTVFDVLTSSLEPVSDDLRETARAEVVYMIRLVCRPYVRSATEVVTEALAASGSTTTLVDAMSATTNWTGAVDGSSVAPATAGGALSVTSAALVGTVTVTMTRTAAIDTSSTKYLVLDWKISAGTKAPPQGSLTATGDGIALTQVASAPSPTAGYTRTTFYVAAAAVASLKLTSATTGTAKSVSVVRSLTLDNLDRSDVRPLVGTARQQIRTIAIGGSAPTTGSVAIEHATNVLGDTILYTCPNDSAHEMYAPANRNNRVSGPGPTADGSAVSGFHDVIDTVTTYDVPVLATPDGDYLVMIRAARGTAPATASLTWTYAPRMSATAMAAAVSNTYAGLFETSHLLHRLGMVHLPLWDMVPGPTAVNRFTFVATNPGTDDLQLDEFYLFNLTTGRLTQVACGTGIAPTSSNRLWVDSPSIENDGLGRLLRGAASDRSDAFSAYPAAVAVGVHEFKPPGFKVFTVTGSTADASVSFRHYPAALSRSAS